MSGLQLDDPALGSAPGWPLVLYFHHVNERVKHYTALAPDAFRRGLEVVLSTLGPAMEPSEVGPGGTVPDHPSVLLTFDDGYRDNLEVAAALLAEFDVRMLLFVVTDKLTEADGLPAARRSDLPPREDYLTWAEALELERAGHVLSAHTRSHPQLRELADAEVTAEIADSLDAVAAHAGSRPRTFAYPYGSVPDNPPVPADVLAFSTVKTAPEPWSAEPHRIRRTYLPVYEPERWARLSLDWKQQWYG